MEHDDLEILVCNCKGMVYAIEDLCSHDGGPLLPDSLGHGTSIAPMGCAGAGRPIPRLPPARATDGGDEVESWDAWQSLMPGPVRPTAHAIDV